MDGAPFRFTIRPDDYHVPYAGTAEDGRKSFLSDELLGSHGGYIALFLWLPDGTFDEMQVSKAERPTGLPPGQAGHAPDDEALKEKLSKLGAPRPDKGRAPVGAVVHRCSTRLGGRRCEPTG